MDGDDHVSPAGEELQLVFWPPHNEGVLTYFLKSELLLSSQFVFSETLLQDDNIAGL